MQNRRLLYTSGLSIIFFANVVLLSGCAASAVNHTANVSAVQVPAKNSQSKQIKKRTPLKANIPLDCTATLLRPARFITRDEHIPVYSPGPRLENIPALIDWGSKRIQIEPARFSHETIPAQYRTEIEKVLVLRERDELIGIPAVYKTTDRPVTLKPAHTRWKKGCVARQDPSACFDNVPARTRILKQRTVDIPNRIIQKRLPAKIMEVKKKVLVKAGRGTGPVIPARYLDVKVGKVTRVWEIRSTYKDYAEPRYATVRVHIKSRKDQLKKFPVLCSNATAAHIKTIQQQLKRRGFPVNITGKLDYQSMRALTQFQQKNDLFMGAISPETLEKLGLR